MGVSLESKRRYGLMLAGGAGAMLVFTAACGGGGDATGKLASGQEGAVTITPGNGTRSVKPDGPIVVKVEDGRLQNVTVQGPGAKISGSLSEDRQTWKSDRTLTPGTSYTVTAQARHDGKTNTATSTFTTLKPAQTLSVTDVTPNVKGEKVGVGMPIFVRFDRAVADRAAVERALKVTPEKPVAGAWRWVAPDQVVYRTAKYWEPHQRVRLTARLAGLNVGGGTYGTEDVDQTITIGAAQITKGDIGKHHMTVTRDGKKLRTIPFSAGNGTTREYTTTSGVHLLMGKENPVTMEAPGRKPGDPGYYKTVVNYGVRFSNSGEFTHSMPSTVSVQGSANVSHGCLNLSPANAKWYYDIAQRGDVMELTGSDRQLEWDNGWGHWQMPFDEWKQGSALS
jgi:lipoprotein-anchoring transpeptidase ErfK/SrfK